MGYYTDFTLKMEPAGAVAYDVEVNDWPVTVGELMGTYNRKWYDYQTDMIAFSKRYPEVLFILDGVGEEQPDIWRCYFEDGKVQKWVQPAIDPEPFDPAKLKGPEDPII